MDAEIVPLPPQRDFTARFGLKFFRLKTLVKRRWWLLALMISLGLAIEGWRVFSKPTRYQSTGLLMVNERPNLPDTAQVREGNEGFWATQIHLLENEQIHDRARRKVALETPGLTSSSVEIVPKLVPKTSIFSVTGIGGNPEYTQRFVQAVMEEFINYKRETVGRIQEGTMGQVSVELQRLGRERDMRESELQSFIKKNRMAFWEEQGKTAAKYLSDLKTKEANLGTELQRLQTLTSKEMLTRPMGNEANDRSIAPEFNQQYVLKSQELIQKKAELAERSKVWKTAHPKLAALREEIANLERLLGTIEEQNRDSSQVRIGAIKAELDVLSSNIREWEQKALAASQKDAEYLQLKDALTRTSNSYDQLLQSLTVIDRGTKFDSGSVHIMQDASAPGLKNPGTFKHLFTGLFLGLVVGLGVLVVMDRADDRFASSTEVMEQFSEPILGQIANVEESRTADGLPLLHDEDERYVYAESFRSLRSSLIFMPNQSELKTLLVTSSIPSEGKSTISTNLAITMALAGTRVLLVDADLRRGDLATLFNLDGRFGLSSILRDEMPWKNVAKPTQYRSLTVIPRGPVTNQSSELLLAPTLEKNMAEWKKEFDLIIFNTSPILATDDTPSIAPNFDGVLMVIRAQFTGARLVRNALNALYQRQVNVLGLVLNCINTEMPDYYYYRYPKYYAA